MLLHDLVDTSQRIGATRSRKAKVTAIAELLDTVEPDELELVTVYLSGQTMQRRTGIGWRSLGDLPAPAEHPTLTVRGVHEALEQASGLQGAGSQSARAALVQGVFGSANQVEQGWLRGLITGELRQGALDALVQEGVAAASGVPLAAVRRAAMLGGTTRAIVRAVFTAGEAGLAEFGLLVGRPVAPMLASSAPNVPEAMLKAAGLKTVGAGGATDYAEVALDAKLDGIRIQVHRTGDDVLVTTRSLDDITSRLPEVVAAARALPVESVVLDGEALALDESGRPRPFQETASRTAQAAGATITPYYFDLLHLDGTDLIDLPAVDRWAALDRLVPLEQQIRRLVSADPEAAAEFLEETLALGHEGVVVKDPGAPYAAGRRGSAWVKVKPVHTLDLVVLAIEWGSGRRQGWLSNIHLGARTDDGFVMLGKTFKGMTDEILTWQTERFLALETHRDGHVVHVRPEQVVEIAFDGVQRSTRYPGGVALRFARVLRYRDDKTPDEADTLATVGAYLGA